MASSGSDPPERKQQLKISEHPRKIKKPPLPPAAVIAQPPIIEHEREPPIITHERESRTIHIKGACDFQDLIHRLTGRSPPSSSSTDSDHDHDHDPSSSHRPIGILSPTPASLPPISPKSFPPPPHPLDDEVFVDPSPSQLPPLEELIIYDYDWEGPADPFDIIPQANFNNPPLPSPNFNNLPPSSSNFNNLPPSSSNFNNNLPLPSPNFNNLRPSSSNFNVRPPPPLYYPPEFPDPFN